MEDLATDRQRHRTSTVSSVKSAAGSVAQAALNALNAAVPPGVWAATAQATSEAPTIDEIRQGEPIMDVARVRARSVTSRRSTGKYEVFASPISEKLPDFESLSEKDTFAQHTQAVTVEDTACGIKSASALSTQPNIGAPACPREESAVLRLPWTTTSWIGFKAFLAWMSRPTGFFITIYALNVVAWGGMLFLLLCNASPAMCYAPDGHFDCNDLYSARRVWIEIDSQILNALFCVTGFGLIPWRFRDLYYLSRWRMCSEARHGRRQKLYGLRKLAGIYRSWIRLPGSDLIGISEHSTAPVPDVEARDDVRLPIPASTMPQHPLTGVRATPTALWKLDFFIWCQVLNTILQAVLCAFMWGYSRFTRPSWATGLFIGLACLVAGLGGIVSYIEGRRIKRIEGVRPSAAIQSEIQKLQYRR